MKGKGVEYLEFSFSIFSQQTYKNFEIIVSDHSVTSAIEELCNKWKSNLNITHIYNTEDRGMFPSNMNNAIKNANGSIIKILCQDDFLYEANSLEILVDNFELNKKYWMVTACCHTNDGVNIIKPFYPIYHNNIQYGNNTISSPSVLMFKNEDVIDFDENLFWLVDCDYYKMLYDRHDLPGICNIITVVNREDHSTRVSGTITEDIKRREYDYVVNKYKIKT